MKVKRKIVVDQDKQKFDVQILPQITPEALTFTSNKNIKQKQSLKVLEKVVQQQPVSNRQYQRCKSQSDSIAQFANNKNIKKKNKNKIQMEQYSSARRTSLDKMTAQLDQELAQVKDVNLIKKRTKKSRINLTKIFKNNNALENIVRKQKVKKLQNLFIKKVRRSSTVRQPVELQQFKGWEKQQFWYLNGIQLKPAIDNLINLLSVLQIISLLIIYSLSLTYQDLIQGNKILSTFQTISLFFYFFEIIINFISIKFQAGKKIVILKDIFNYYLQNHLIIDLISFCILLLDISTSFAVISYFRLFIIFKLPQCLRKIQKLQVYFIQNMYNQQYWNLGKVFIVNFCFAHVIALFLTAMTLLSPQNNWMKDKGIIDASWVQKYVWSFYWASNIMLTVGFGDLKACNYKQATCLIFIQTFSCIVMAYNINCMGSIISLIRAEDQKRSKKYKIFKKLTDNNNVPKDLTFKISNYIEQSSNLRKKFNFQEDQQFLNQLPQALKVSYLRQANKQVMKQLIFFKDLLEKTLYSFAEHMETKISHPQEVIRSIDDDFDLLILRKGHIGYACNRPGSSLDQQIVDMIQVKENGVPFLTSLDFISKIRPFYQVISLKFSVLFKMNYNYFINIFKQSQMDYELFCFLRDKIRNIPDQFQVHTCQFCKNFNHFKFTCPKLHYMPYQQHIINKQIHNQKIGFNKRKQQKRWKNDIMTPFQLYKKIKKYKKQIKQLQSQVSVSFKKRRRQTKKPFDLYTKKQDLRQREDARIINFQNQTKQLIQIQFLNQEKRDLYHDQIWGIKTDHMMDFNSYFHEHNPKNIGQRFKWIYLANKSHKKIQDQRESLKSIKNLDQYNYPQEDRCQQEKQESQSLGIKQSSSSLHRLQTFTNFFS